MNSTPRCLVVTATNDDYAKGVKGMIKSFILNSGLSSDYLVLGKNLSSQNKKTLSDLPRTRVHNLWLHNSRDHWCTWILETFFLEETSKYDYVFYVDSDIMICKSLVDFVKKFSSYSKADMCVIDHNGTWHKDWFWKGGEVNPGWKEILSHEGLSRLYSQPKTSGRIEESLDDDDPFRGLKFYKPHVFNAGFIVFKNRFFGSSNHKKLKLSILNKKPDNDEKFLRHFFREESILHAPTKFNARVIWLDKYGDGYSDEDVHVMHFVGQENKPWLNNKTKWESEWHKIFNKGNFNKSH
tara:strand:- start:8757 stop:9644 length:888 start_codon:yes stop_codon:yes gene_type:complete